MKRFNLLLLSLLPFVIHANSSLTGYSLKLVEPLNQRAIIKSPGGKLLVLKPGDEIDSSGVKVVEMFQNKVVLELSVTLENDRVERQKVIMIKTKNSEAEFETLALTNYEKQIFNGSNYQQGYSQSVENY